MKPEDENNRTVWNTDPDLSLSFTDIRKSNGVRKSVENPPVYQCIVRGHCVNVIGLDNFFFRLEDADMQMKDIQRELDISKLRAFNTPIQVGQYCLCKHKNGKLLSRAQVIEVKNDNMNINVVYIDYGNIERVKVNHLFKLNSKLKTIAPLVLNCRLRISKELQHIKKLVSEGKRDLKWLDDHFRQIVSSKKIITLKQVKEEDCNVLDNDGNQPIICVDLYSKSNQKNLLQILLSVVMNELKQ